MLTCLPASLPACLRACVLACVHACVPAHVPRGASRYVAQLYFFGALCWKTETKVHTLAQLAAKCQASYAQPGFLSKYSFGLRYEIFRRRAPAMAAAATAAAATRARLGCH